ATLNTTYATATPTDPFCSSAVVSSENEENVVNPPHRPTLMNKTICGLTASFFAASAAMTPITSAPVTFTSSVMNGKPSSARRGIKLIQYRQTAPINPPKPT